MNPIVPILLIFGSVVAWSIFKTAKAVANLNYTITRFGLYRVNTDGITFRLQVRLTNPKSTPLRVNLIDIAAYLNSTTSYDAQGKLIVNSRGDLLSTYSDANGFVIAANNFTTKDFLLQVRWGDIGRLLFNNISAVIDAFTNNNSLSRVVTALIGRNVLIYGLIKAENVIIDIASVVNIIDERNN